MWKQKSDTIPNFNCFQLIEEQGSKKKKKSFALSVLPLAWTPICEMRNQTGKRELIQLPPGKYNVLEYFFPTVKIYFCSFISLFIPVASLLRCEPPVLRWPAPSMQDSRMSGRKAVLTFRWVWIHPK